jgi:hypothetical protein
VFFYSEEKMVEEFGQQDAGERFFTDLNTRIRDLEEKQRLVKDRMMLISESFVKERDKNFEEIQDMKRMMEKIRLENDRLKELLLRVSEIIDSSARKEELMILQRQFDMFREIRR